MSAVPQHSSGFLPPAPQIAPEDALLTPGEVAALFRVEVKSVGRWGREGKLRSVRTLGGHRRYYRAEVEAFLRGERP